MKPEQTELLLVDELISKSLKNLEIKKPNELEISKLTGDASTRRYFRVTLNEDTNFVVCLADPFSGEVKDHDFLSMQNILKKNHILVPEIYDFKLDKGYILQEDLGDTTLLYDLSNITSIESEFDVYKKAVDILLKMHSIKSEKWKKHLYLSREFDFEKYMYEFKFMEMHFFKSYLKKNINHNIQNILDEGFKYITQELLKEELIFTHRDFHSRNIMIKNNNLVLIDFQDARLGPRVYDLVSLLEDSYYKINSKNKEKLKGYYCSKSGINWYDFERPYKMMTIQRTLKAIGSFAYIYNHREDDRYLKYIGFAFEKVKEFLIDLPELKEFKKTICKMYYES